MKFLYNFVKSLDNWNWQLLVSKVNRICVQSVRHSSRTVTVCHPTRLPTLHGTVVLFSGNIVMIVLDQPREWMSSQPTVFYSTFLFCILRYIKMISFLSQFRNVYCYLLYVDAVQ